jgi:acetylornithine deacetylase/succinyl-diaminopimelate desuccinylase-like protein
VRALAPAIILAILLGVPFRGAPAADLDWYAVEKEAAAMLASYIRIDTSNPPGNEREAAEFLARQFETGGIRARILESAPGRASVVARLEGSGEKRPIVLLNHLDVVPAVASEWKEPPFSGTIRDGYVHGRGAMDCKGVGVADAMAMLLFKRHGVKLKRDVVFVGTADEETGGKLGAGWLLEKHPDVIGNAEFVLNEGGHILHENGKRIFEVSTVEKTPCWLRLTARGKAGHGSTPPDDAATNRLVRALDRIGKHEPEVKVVAEVQNYYAGLAEIVGEPLASKYKNLRRSLIDEEFRREFLSDPRNAALVRNTIVPTLLEGSGKTNVIPASAAAELDCRLLPGESKDEFVRSIVAAIDDTQVDVEVILNFPSGASSSTSLLFDSIRVVARREGAPIVASVLRGFTDSHFFRARGIASYGFTPFDLSPDDLGRMHGIDERISTANLRDGTRRIADILWLMDR